MYLGALLAALTCVEHMKKSGSGGIALRCHFQDVAFRLRFGIRLASEPVSHVFGKQCLTEKLIFPFNNASSPPRDLRHFRRIEAPLNGHSRIRDENLVVDHKNRGLQNDEATDQPGNARRLETVLNAVAWP